MKSILNIVCIFFILINSFAQKNLKPGYIVTQEYDTLKGHIDYLVWDSTPTKILFYDENSNATEFEPIQIKAFGVMSKHYVSESVELETSTRNINSIDTGDDLKITKKVVFLQRLIAGEKSLYFNRTENGIDNFYIVENGEFILLIYKIYLIEGTSNVGVELTHRFSNENNKFIGQLTYYFSDCKISSKNYENLKYSLKSLLSLFERYYECRGIKPHYQTSLPKMQVILGPSFGWNINTLSFDYPISHINYDYLRNSDWKHSGFSAGIFFDLLNPKSKLSFHSEFLYSKFKSENNYNFTQGITEFDIEAVFDLQYIRSIISLHYQAKRIPLFFEVGPSFNYLIGDNSSKTERREFSNRVEITTEHPIQSGINKVSPGLNVSIGTNYDNMDFRLRMERMIGIGQKTKDLGSYYNRIEFVLNYSLIK